MSGSRRRCCCGNMDTPIGIGCCNGSFSNNFDQYPDHVVNDDQIYQFGGLYSHPVIQQTFPEPDIILYEAAESTVIDIRVTGSIAWDQRILGFYESAEGDELVFSPIGSFVQNFDLQMVVRPTDLNPGNVCFPGVYELTAPNTPSRHCQYVQELDYGFNEPDVGDRENTDGVYVIATMNVSNLRLVPALVRRDAGEPGMQLDTERPASIIGTISISSRLYRVPSAANRDEFDGCEPCFLGDPGSGAIPLLDSEPWLNIDIEMTGAERSDGISAGPSPGTYAADASPGVTVSVSASPPEPYGLSFEDEYNALDTPVGASFVDSIESVFEGPASGFRLTTWSSGGLNSSNLSTRDRLRLGVSSTAGIVPHRNEIAVIDEEPDLPIFELARFDMPTLDSIDINFISGGTSVDPNFAYRPFVDCGCPGADSMPPDPPDPQIAGCPFVFQVQTSPTSIARCGDFLGVIAGPGSNGPGGVLVANSLDLCPDPADDLDQIQDLFNIALALGESACTLCPTVCS